MPQNWFFITHICLQQLRSRQERLKLAVYALLVASFAICRLGICTWMLVLFSIDLSRFTSDSAAEWAFVGAQYAIFVFVWSLSWYFVWRELQPAVGPAVEKSLSSRLDNWREARRRRSAVRALRSNKQISATDASDTKADAEAFHPAARDAYVAQHFAPKAVSGCCTPSDGDCTVSSV